jgi:hypothetical protein
MTLSTKPLPEPAGACFLNYPHGEETICSASPVSKVARSQYWYCDGSLSLIRNYKELNAITFLPFFFSVNLSFGDGMAYGFSACCRTEISS